MTMYIERAVVTNFKRIKGVDITSDGGEITLSGKNFQGKSSFIDAIWNALGGKQRAVTKPVKEGEKKASAAITIVDDDGDGYVVTRTWNGTSSKLVVKTKGGKAALTAPQDILDGLIGKFAFDPMAFTTLSTNAQRDVLMDLIGIDLEAHDDERANKYDERTEVGRDKKRAQGNLDSLEAPAKDVPTEAVSIASLAQQVQDAETSQRVIELCRSDYQKTKDRIKSIQIQLATEKEHLVDIGREGAEAVAQSIDPEPLREQLNSAEEVNQQVRDAQQYREAAKDVEECDDLYEALSDDIKAMDAERAEILSSAKLPIDRLSFDDTGVLYKEVPLSQASAAELREVSFAMAVAMDPELRVCCIKDASLFDEEQLQHIRDLAGEHNFQLVLELVGDHSGATAHFEDGEVK